MKAPIAFLVICCLCIFTHGQQGSAAQSPQATPAAQQGSPETQQQPAGAPPAAGSSNVAASLHVYAYPKGNQTPEQQSRDEAACYQSAQTANGQAQGQAEGSEGQGEQQQASNAGKGKTAKG